MVKEYDLEENGKSNFEACWRNWKHWFELGKQRRQTRKERCESNQKETEAKEEITMIKLFPIIPSGENLALASQLLMYARRKKRKHTVKSNKSKIVFIKHRYSGDDRGLTKGTPPSEEYDYRKIRNRNGRAERLHEQQMREEERDEPEEAEYVYPEEEVGYRRKKKSSRSKVDLKRYMGTWKQISVNPEPRFQRGCKNVKAIYKLRPDGKVAVTNVCDGRKIKGVARSVSDSNRHLKVSFFPLIWANYNIVKIDKNYKNATVKGGKYTWKLKKVK